MPYLKRFLFAFFFYSMGVQTVMLVATLFGEKRAAPAYVKTYCNYLNFAVSGHTRRNVNVLFIKEILWEC